MIITIHQPEHLPWLGLFNKIAKADKFVILDSVQYEKNYFQNRNRILGTNGVQWLSIPISNKGHMDGSIATTLIASDPKNAKWKEKYLQTIRMSYGKYPYFNEVYPVLEEAMNVDTDLFCEINISIIKAFCEKLEIFPEYVRSSQLKVNGLKSDLILDICKAVDTDVYIAGPSGRDYLDMTAFEKAGIKVVFNDYHHPQYPQRRSEDFISHLSALDLFMNVGFAEAKKVIMVGNEPVYDFAGNVCEIR
ncbi:MAG: WbqC family protein [Erysipelotrichaceae bacterium]|nr:WbqC family protein [Erysipelotrichaceae bacterium]